MPVGSVAMPFKVGPPLLAMVDPGILYSIAMLAALVSAIASARRSGLNTYKMYWAVVLAIFFGLGGAHLLGLLVHGWSGGPMAMLRFWQGGNSLFGGLLLGGLAAAFYFRRRAMPVLAYADAAMPALALGYAIGRVGCFLNGDDYGTLTHVRWAVRYPPGTEAYQAHLARGWISPTDSWSLPVHPVQLYSSLLGLLLFVVLVIWRPKWQGGRLCVYLLTYGLGRFLLEYLRGDFRRVLGPFSLPQIFSLALILLAAHLWLQRRKAQAACPVPDQARSIQWQPL